MTEKTRGKWYGPRRVTTRIFRHRCALRITESVPGRDILSGAINDAAFSRDGVPYPSKTI